MYQHSNYRSPRRRREKEYEKIFEVIVVENFPNMEKEIDNQCKQCKGFHTGQNQGETGQDTY